MVATAPQFAAECADALKCRLEADAFGVLQTFTWSLFITRNQDFALVRRFQ